MTGISIEQVGKDLWFRGDDGTLVTAAVCLVLGRDDRNNMPIIPEKRHLGIRLWLCFLLRIALAFQALFLIP